MKDRMKRLSILFMATTLCTGTVYAQSEPISVDAEMQMEAEHSEEEKAADQNEGNESQPENTETPESESQTTEPPDAESQSPESEAQTEASENQTSESETPSEVTEQPATENPGAGDESQTEKMTESQTEQESQTEKETEVQKAEMLVKISDGTVLQKERLDSPKTLTVGQETHPADYQQGVWKITVPKGTASLQITVPDQKEEELLFTKWNGYLTESEKKWYLCPDDPTEDAYTTQGNTYTLDLTKFALSMEEITKEQLAVYGELEEDREYAEILLSGDDRAELLLVEFAADPVEETTEEEITESTAESETEENRTEAMTENPTEKDEAAEIAVLSADPAQINQTYTAAGKNLSDSAKKSAPTVASINGEWQILGLTRSGQLSDEIRDKYLANVINELKKTNGVLHAKKYTEYSRVVLALTSMGVDVTNVAGYNLLQPLSDYKQTVWQGINGATWALIAFDSHNYEIPQAEAGKEQNSREKLIANILEQELSTGGWDLSGRSADPDMTAMVIQALAPYYSTNMQVKEAVDRGLNRLSSMQKSSGAFATYGSETSESCSQVIVALTALGIDPNTDSRFVKNGKSVVDALLSFANRDGSFHHVLNGAANQMATEQAYYALTAYQRFTGGKNRLYDMTDVELEKNGASAGETGNGSENGTGSGTGSGIGNGSGSGAGNGSGNGSGNGTKPDKKKKKTTGSTKKVNLTSGKKGGTSAGKSASGKTGADAKKKEAKKDEKEKKTSEKKTSEKKGGTKTEKEVTSLITELNGLFRKTKTSEKLPDHAADYTDAQKEQVLDIYRAYSELTDAQKKEVEQSSHYQDYQDAVTSLKEVNHYDEAAGIDLRENEEDILPWYIQVEASALNVEKEQAEQVSEALKGQGALLNLTDISLIDLLDHTEWEPEDLVRVSIPLADLGDYENVAIVHLKEDGGLEFIEGHIAGSNIEFDTDRFSRFGVAGYHGSMEELMKTEEGAQKPVWMYLIPGACAAALLAVFGAIRISLSRKCRKKKGEDGER